MYNQFYNQSDWAAVIGKFSQQITDCLGRSDWELKSSGQLVNILSPKLPCGEYILSLPNEVGMFWIAKFTLTPMVNCCGICVSTAASVLYQYQGKGLGTLLNQVRIDIARALGYGVLLCTDVESNIPQRKILSANGWKDIFKFINPRTRNTVIISVVNL